MSDPQARVCDSLVERGNLVAIYEGDPEAGPDPERDRIAGYVASEQMLEAMQQPHRTTKRDTERQPSQESLPVFDNLVLPPLLVEIPGARSA